MSAYATRPAPGGRLDFLPLTRPTIDEATIAGVAEVLRSGWITSGPMVKEFEAKLSEYFGGRPVRAFNSGTCTMEIALRIAGIGPGHEVITTPLSWVATSNVILAVGSGSDRGGDHTRDPRPFAGGSGGIAGRSGPVVRHRADLRPACH
jgi:DegT/DnrJ/EryC1/StrS aminotransferase family